MDGASVIESKAGGVEGRLPATAWSPWPSCGATVPDHSAIPTAACLLLIRALVFLASLEVVMRPSHPPSLSLNLRSLECLVVAAHPPHCHYHHLSFCSGKDLLPPPVVIIFPGGF